METCLLLAKSWCMELYGHLGFSLVENLLYTVYLVYCLDLSVCCVVNHFRSWDFFCFFFLGVAFLCILMINGLRFFKKMITDLCYFCLIAENVSWILFIYLNWKYTVSCILLFCVSVGYCFCFGWFLVTNEEEKLNWQKINSILALLKLISSQLLSLAVMIFSPQFTNNCLFICPNIWWDSSSFKTNLYLFWKNRTQWSSLNLKVIRYDGVKTVVWLSYLVLWRMGKFLWWLDSCCICPWSQ